MRRILTALLLLAPLYGPAAAQSGASTESAYTTFDTDKCRHTPRPSALKTTGPGSAQGMPGSRCGSRAGDQRMYVSFGRKAADEPAASETLPGFNDVY